MALLNCRHQAISLFDPGQSKEGGFQRNRDFSPTGKEDTHVVPSKDSMALGMSSFLTHVLAFVLQIAD